jgi:bla regulator protein BlaR1
MNITVFGHGISLAPVINHLWQSTMVAAIALLLALILRRNRASLRYWIWLAASLKFLLPFSLLIYVGHALRPAQASPSAEMLLFTGALDQLAQPFSQLRPSPPHAATVISQLREWLPYALLALWVAGSILILLYWWRRRHRIARALRTASPSSIAAEIPVLCTKTLLEPGVFGIFRPILLLPTGISERLTSAQLRAIVAHEMGHVRRRDNLTSALHMLVEALFWFHPLVWWMGARLVDERERACDEHVLALGSDPQVYAESILKVCNFYLESPLPCAAGVTGSHLKKRIEAIMTNRTISNLGSVKILILVAAGVAALLLPIGFGVLHASQSEGRTQPQHDTINALVYEAASIRIDEAGSASLKTGDLIHQRMQFNGAGFTAKNASLRDLIRLAYGVEDYQIWGVPYIFKSDLYDVEAKAQRSLADELQRLPDDQRELQNRRMLQSLLEDRFQLKVHRKTIELPAFSLVVAKSGRLPEATGDCKPGSSTSSWKPGMPAPPPPCGGLRMLLDGGLDGRKVAIKELVADLSAVTGRPVQDKTNLIGKYDINLQWFPDPNEFSSEPETMRAPDPNRPGLLSALEEQLGLKLEPETKPVEVLFIDHAERIPTAESNAPPNNMHSASSPFESVAITPNRTGEPMAGFTVRGRPMQAVAFRPDRFVATNFPLRGLIRVAYAVEQSRILDGPAWIDSEKYDVEAKLDPTEIQKLATLSLTERNIEQSRLVQELLADYFKLVLHHDTKQLLGYALVVAAGGPKVQKAKPGDTYPNGIAGPGGLPIGGGTLVQPEKSKLVGQGVPLSDLAKELSQYELNRPVLDLTGLPGNYDFTLQWTASTDKNVAQDTSSILAAIQNQLGLQLNAQNLPTDVLVIDRAERPAQNR